MELTVTTTNNVTELETKGLIKPFTTKDTPMPKLYLILKCLMDKEHGEEIVRDFEFVRGTRQQVYDYIKGMITDEFMPMDIMLSRIYVDSPKISIGYRCSIYTFMNNMKTTNKVIDETSFDLSDYYYELDEDQTESEVLDV